MRRQAASWLKAVRRTHSPIGRIRPLSSAAGMNSAGETGPSSGCVQRSKASAPTRCPSCKQITDKYGWKFDVHARDWKAACPSCGGRFPKNDFAAYYASGLDARLVWEAPG